MPGNRGFTSKAQQGLIFAKQARGELKPGTAQRMAAETPSFKRLPQHHDEEDAKPKSYGGLANYLASKKRGAP